VSGAGDDNKPQAEPGNADIGMTFEVVEGDVVSGEKVASKGIYLLPNLFTTAALFSGFYAIVAAMKGLSDSSFIEPAAVACFIAMVLDILDGRVARMTNTQSAFGAQYDSLSDCVAFGVAPALLAFAWSLNYLGKAGWMVAFIYMACVALRLARFNTQIASTDKRYFTGLPSPAAAAVVASMVWCAHDMALSGEQWVLVAALMTAYAGIMMVSNIKYNSFKDIDFKGRVPFIAIMGVIMIFVVVFIYPPQVLLLFALAYSFSGPVMMLKRRYF